ncbi:MAG: glycosyltransferase family 39 protein [Deltaproteobacteria bacterium]|nr:glycosyltransferase family 39 protein [Deltaproteobacteria bacterium]
MSEASPAPGGAPRPRVGAVALLALALACGAVGQWHFESAQPWRVQQWERFVAQRTAGVIWYGAMAIAAALFVWRARDWPPPVAGRRLRWAAGTALLLLVVAAGWLRFHRLHELPPGLWVDEALNGVQAVQIAASGRPLAALPPEDLRTGLGAGFVDLAGLAFALFDFDDGPWGVRAVAAVIGIAAVAAASALAWVWFGPLAALAAGGWLTISQWHLNYSRWGEMPLMSSLVETLIALGVTVALRARGRRAWAAWLFAGVMTGLGVYTYQTFRLFIVLAGGAAGLCAWRRRAVLVPHRRPLLAALLLAAVVTLPMLRYALSAPEQFGERAMGTLILGREDWRAQLADSLPRSLLAFQLVGDDNPRHNLPFAPLLTPIPAVLAGLGLALCLARARHPPCGATALWFAIALVPAVITLEAPHASRLLDAIVPLALMIGVAVQALIAALQVLLPARLAAPAAFAAAGLAAALTARAEWHQYFVAREALPAFTDAFFPYESAPGRYLARHAPDATVYLDPVTYWQPATFFVAHRYLETRPNDVRELFLAHDFPPRAPLTRDALYLLPRPYATFAAVLESLSPDTACETVRDRFARVDMIACRVPRDAMNDAIARGWRPPYGLRGRFYRGGENGALLAETPLPYALAEYSLDRPPVGHFDLAVWEGTIDLPVDGEYFFRLNPDTTTLEIDGQRILSHHGDAAFGGANEGRARLRAGRRPIRITLAPGTGGPNFLWFYWQPPGGEGDWVPATVLRPAADRSAASPPS